MWAKLCLVVILLTVCEETNSVRQCGLRLINILNDICKGNFRGPNGCGRPKREVVESVDHLFRRNGRNVKTVSIVDRCCL